MTFLGECADYVDYYLESWKEQKRTADMPDPLLGGRSVGSFCSYINYLHIEFSLCRCVSASVCNVYTYARRAPLACMVKAVQRHRRLSSCVKRFPLLSLNVNMEKFFNANVRDIRVVCASVAVAAVVHWTRSKYLNSFFLIVWLWSVNNSFSLCHIFHRLQFGNGFHDFLYHTVSKLFQRKIYLKFTY